MGERTVTRLPDDRGTGVGRVGFYDDGELKHVFETARVIGGQKKQGLPPGGEAAALNKKRQAEYIVVRDNWLKGGLLPGQECE